MSSYYPEPPRWLWLIVFIIVWALVVHACSCAGVDQAERWNRARVRPGSVLRADKAVALYQKTKARYDFVQHLRDPGAPAPVIFTWHGRESDWSFRRHLHEGSLLTGRTRDEPKGRPINHPPPFTWEESAEDALYILKHEQRVDWRSCQAALQAIEAFNGLGYQWSGRYSPYVWSGTNLYERGKFVRDHVFDPTALDQQLGCAAILMRMRDRGIELPWPNPEASVRSMAERLTHLLSKSQSK